MYMNKNVAGILLLAAGVAIGYSIASIGLHETVAEEPAKVISMENKKKGRVTGIGGIFFKCNNPEELRSWYRDHLGFNTDEYGTNFEWFQGADSTKKGSTQWSPFGASTGYFAPSEKEYMINYRVENLDELLEELKKAGVTILDNVESYDYGRFVHIMDPDGNKIELWEPVDEEYEKVKEGRTK